MDALHALPMQSTLAFAAVAVDVVAAVDAVDADAIDGYLKGYLKRRSPRSIDYFAQLHYY